MFRVTGRVVRVDEKSGSKANATTGEVRDWSMTIAKVLVAEQAITEVTLFSDSPEREHLSVGAEVDWAVEVAVRNGRLSVQLDKSWSEAAPATPARPKVARAS